MISDITVEAKLRTKTGSAESRRLRRQGFIPAIVYGDKKDPVAVTVNTKQITLILRSETGHNTIFKLSTPDHEDATVMIKEWEIDPVKGKLTHADFFRISLTEKQHVSVPIELTGEATGAKQDGGIIDHVLRELEIECLPTDIPEHISVDISHLKVGDHVMVKDLKVPVNVRVLSSPDQVVALVATTAEEESAAAQEVAEPEVIKKGKQEEE